MLTKTITLAIKLYQTAVSPLLRNNCRFYPSCSEYAREAFESHGIMKGTILSVKRFSKCHPLHPGGFDPVPENEKQVY